VSYVDGIVTMDVWRSSAQLLLLFGRSVICHWAATKFFQARHDVYEMYTSSMHKQATTSPFPVNFGP